MTYKWHLIFTDEAREQIDALTREDMMLIFEKIADLANVHDPYSLEEVTDIKKLRDRKYQGLWRKRAGDWRILYRVDINPLIHLKVEYKGRLVVTQIVNRRDL